MGPGGRNRGTVGVSQLPTGGGGRRHVLREMYAFRQALRSAAAAPRAASRRWDVARPLCEATRATCPSCGASVGCEFFCGACGALQPVFELEERGVCSALSTFQVEASFKMDRKALEKRFRELQGALHPDKFAAVDDAGLQDLAQRNSAMVNRHYQALLDPVKRLAFLLDRTGIRILEEGGAEKPSPAILMEVMDYRERIEESTRPEELDALMEECSRKADEIVEQVELEWAEQDLDSLTQLALRLRYIVRVLEEADDVQRRLHRA